MKITSPYRGRESRHIHNTSLITVFLYVFVLFSWKTKFTSKIGFIKNKVGNPLVADRNVINVINVLKSNHFQNVY